MFGYKRGISYCVKKNKKIKDNFSRMKTLLAFMLHKLKLFLWFQLNIHI